jgi:hypothetical protein
MVGMMVAASHYLPFRYVRHSTYASYFRLIEVEAWGQ